LSKLDAAEQSLARGYTKTAANQLNAFINKVQAMQRTERLLAEAADELIRLAQTVINALGPL
jgi:hypothetical protein